MVNMQHLDNLKENNKVSQDVFDVEQKRLASKIVAKEARSSGVNGIVYIVLAFCLGTLGIHNFYAKYWKRGIIQAFLTVVAQYLLYIPLLFTSIWAEMELLFVNRDSKGILFRGSRRIIWLLRLASMVVLVWAIMSIEKANMNGILEDLDELYGVETELKNQQIEQM